MSTKEQKNDNKSTAKSVRLHEVVTRQLTDDQIESWRTILSMTFGAYAQVMPREEVQAYRDKMQNLIDNDNKSV